MPYEYPVAFDRAVLDPANPLLADMLALREPDKRHRCLFFVDEGVADARPAIAAEIEAYAEAHAARMVLAAPPRMVAGGERVKSELTHLEKSGKKLLRKYSKAGYFFGIISLEYQAGVAQGLEQRFCKP